MLQNWSGHDLMMMWHNAHKCKVNLELEELQTKSA